MPCIAACQTCNACHEDVVESVLFSGEQGAYLTLSAGQHPSTPRLRLRGNVCTCGCRRMARCPCCAAHDGLGLCRAALRSGRIQLGARTSHRAGLISCMHIQPKVLPYEQLASDR